jgi:hypothetical protein
LPSLLLLRHVHHQPFNFTPATQPIQSISVPFLTHHGITAIRTRKQLFAICALCQVHKPQTNSSHQNHHHITVPSRPPFTTTVLNPSHQNPYPFYSASTTITSNQTAASLPLSHNHHL